MVINPLPLGCSSIAPSDLHVWSLIIFARKKYLYNYYVNNLLYIQISKVSVYQNFYIKYNRSLILLTNLKSKIVSQYVDVFRRVLP
jgi:hypothetical protein